MCSMKNAYKRPHMHTMHFACIEHIFHSEIDTDTVLRENVISNDSHS